MEIHDPFGVYCESLALLYHEARNVRHLLHARLIECDHCWQKLVQLPTNRYDAWRQVWPLLQKARSTASSEDAAEVFISDFGVRVQELRTLFENKNWRHAKAYGGNAWSMIAGWTLALGRASSSGNEESARRIA